MFISYFRKYKINTDNKIYEDFVIRMQYIQGKLEKVRQMFDMENDPDKIEALIYEEKALMIRLNHLIKTAKEQGLYNNDTTLFR